MSKVRFCCSVKPSQLWWGLLPISNINEIFRTIPCLALNLPPLSKGGGLTARHKLLSCCVLIATHPPFLFTKLFCHQDGGIAIPPFAQHHIYASLVKGEVLSPERIRATTRGIATPLSPRPAPPHQPFQTRTIPLAFRRGVSLLLPLHLILPPSQPLQKDNNPSPRTTTLASLAKGEVD